MTSHSFGRQNFFSAGELLEKNQLRGFLKGKGSAACCDVLVIVFFVASFSSSCEAEKVFVFEILDFTGFLKSVLLLPLTGGAVNFARNCFKGYFIATY